MHILLAKCFGVFAAVVLVIQHFFRPFLLPYFGKDIIWLTPMLGDVHVTSIFNDG